MIEFHNVQTWICPDTQGSIAYLLWTFFWSRDLDPMTFIYEYDPYCVEIHGMCKYELPVWSPLKVFVWQTEKHTESTEIVNHAISLVVKNKQKIDWLTRIVRGGGHRKCISCRRCLRWRPCEYCWFVSVDADTKACWHLEHRRPLLRTQTTNFWHIRQKLLTWSRQNRHPVRLANRDTSITGRYRADERC